MVDTITLTKRQLSTEAGIKKNTLVRLNNSINWQTPGNNTIDYQLTGPDGIPDTGDDISRAVKIGMLPTDAPINLSPRHIMALLLDGSYITSNWNSTPHKIERCSSNFTSFTLITNFSNGANEQSYDARRIIIIVDGKIKRYDYVSNTLITLYTPGTNERVIDSRLDRDGYFYFATATTVSPYTNKIKRVPVNGGAVQTLATFTTTAQLNNLRIELSPTHVVYTLPNDSLTGQIILSVPKGGGTPVVLSVNHVYGGVAGQYVFSEDTSGRVHRVNLDGTGRITSTDAQLNGATFGGSADWHYRFNPSTFRGLGSGINNKLGSYGINDDFTNPAVGILMGTIPVNLSNFGGFDIGINMLVSAGKRNIDASFGTDILLLKATTASSLSRLTNINGHKEPFPFLNN